MNGIIEGSTKIIVDACFKAGYQKGREDREKEILTYLVRNGYIKYGFDEEYLAERIKEQKNDY